MSVLRYNNGLDNIFRNSFKSLHFSAVHFCAVCCAVKCCWLWPYTSRDCNKHLTSGCNLEWNIDTTVEVVIHQGRLIDYWIARGIRKWVRKKEESADNGQWLEKCREIREIWWLCIHRLALCTQHNPVLETRNLPHQISWRFESSTF